MWPFRRLTDRPDHPAAAGSSSALGASYASAAVTPILTAQERSMYQWLVFVHLIGLVLFVAMHGVAMFMAFRLRIEREPATAKLLLGLSSRANQVMYIGFLLLGIGGLGAAGSAGLLVAPWIVASYVVLIVVFIAMYALGAGFYYPLREALEGKDGAPPIDSTAMVARLQNRRPEALALFGFGGLAILVWLMVFKPG